MRQYDSRSRHTKGLRPLELRHYRDAWTFEAAQRYADPLSIDERPGPNRTLRSILRRHPVFRAYRRLATGDVAHQLLQVQLHGSHLTVLCTEWISVGPLRGLQFIGNFKCYRGSSSRDRGTHDLLWNGTEFVGAAWEMLGLIMPAGGPTILCGARMSNPRGPSVRTFTPASATGMVDFATRRLRADGSRGCRLTFVASARATGIRLIARQQRTRFESTAPAWQAQRS